MIFFKPCVDLHLI